MEEYFRLHGMFYLFETNNVKIMPDQAFHIQKTSRFRSSGEHLRLRGPPDSTDAAVQDFFYAAMHEVERFLSLFGKHTNHRQRHELIKNKRIIKRGSRVSIEDPTKLRRRILTRSRIEYSIDGASEGFYFNLFAMRQLKTYGSLPGNLPVSIAVGGSRFANALNVDEARELFRRLSSSLRRYERYLRRQGIL